jgi:peptidoglycan/LPS O-acetylase OafA/YrhL
MYGRLSVVFFLALSGFSLALGPAAHRWRLGGTGRFLRRRAWRILPAYWAALTFSLLIAYQVPASYQGAPTHRSIAVFGLLLQDVFWARTPNGALWSVAVEVELYLLFPLFLLIRRRLGAVALLASVTVPAIVYGVLHGVPAEGATGLTPHLAPVFVAGVAAAGVMVARDRWRAAPWHWLAAATTVPVLYAIHLKGPYWTGHHYFWIDLAITPGLTMLILAVATGRVTALTRLLSSRPLHQLGRISYSLYLIHLPIVVAISLKLVAPRLGHGTTAFGVTVLLAGGLSLAGAWLFARVFEFPFQRYRSWAELRSRVGLRTVGSRRRETIGSAGPDAFAQPAQLTAAGLAASPVEQ